jgi:hypothetical protein
MTKPRPAALAIVLKRGWLRVVLVGSAACGSIM